MTRYDAEDDRSTPSREPPLTMTPLSAHAEHQFQLLVQSVVDYAIYMLDPNGYIVSWNSGAQEIKGYAAEEVLGRYFGMFYTDEDRRAGVPGKVLEIARTQGRYNGEAWRVRRDGSRFRALVAVDAIRDDAGALVGFAKVTRDVTRRWEATMRLEESERRFRLFAEGAKDYAICMFDNAGGLTDWNSGAQRMLGYAREEVLGKHWSILLEHGETVTEGMLSRDDDNTVEEEHVCRRNDGTHFAARIRIYPLRDPDGQLHGHALVMRDITQQRATEDQLESTREQLAQSRRLDALGQLTAGIAHDFNNILQNLAGSLEVSTLQLHRNDPDKAEHHLRNAMGSVERAKNLTQRLLAFTRRQPLVRSHFDLGRQVVAMMDLLERTVGMRVSVSFDIGCDALPICSDATQLETALLNLAINGRDAMPGGGRLHIRTWLRKGEAACDSRAVLTVEDTGVGMDEELAGKVFEPFFTTKAQGQGTGLGLSMIRSFMDQSGGEVSMRSSPGQGTQVALTFPLDDDESRPCLA